VLARLRFYLIKIKVDGASRAVDDGGDVDTPDGQIDVENLLIRSIVARAHCGVYNVANWRGFRKPFATRLDVVFEGFPGLPGVLHPDQVRLASNAGF
jgi:hypothetical protein